jgi:hypothetical protein
MALPERALVTEDAPAARGVVPARYDLREDRQRSVRADRFRYGIWGTGLFLFGLFMLLGGVLARLWLLVGIGLLLSVAAGLALYFTFAVGILGVEIGESGITLTRVRQPPFLLRWEDPKLSIDLTEITVAPTSIVHADDPRTIHPQWAFFLHPMRMLTTVPKELEEHLARAAESKGLSVVRTPVLLFWTGSTRSPANLVSRDVEPGDTTVPNGRVTRIRPRDSSAM